MRSEEEIRKEIAKHEADIARTKREVNQISPLRYSEKIAYATSHIEALQWVLGELQ